MKKRVIALGVLAISTLSTTVFAQSGDTIAKATSSGKVMMGTRESSSPLAFTLGAGKFAGYHVEICEAVLAKVLPKAKVEYTAVTSANRIQLMQNGTIDIECGSTTNNKARQKDVSFALTTFLSEVRMAVKADSGIESIAQLNGKNVATTTGTTSVQLLRKNERAKGIDFKEIYGKDHADSFEQVVAGRADAFVMDNNLLAGFIATSANPKAYKITGEVLSVEPIAIMMRKDDAKFKKAVDDALVGMFKDGTIEKLYNKWFLSPIPPKNTNTNLAMSTGFKELVKAPNDKPAEDYNK